MTIRYKDMGMTARAHLFYGFVFYSPDRAERFDGKFEERLEENNFEWPGGLDVEIIRNEICDEVYYYLATSDSHFIGGIVDVVELTAQTLKIPTEWDGELKAASRYLGISFRPPAWIMMARLV